MRCLAKRGEVALGEREGHADRPDLRDRHQTGRIVDADEIARRHADGADAAADRRLDLGVVELQIVGSQLSLVGLDVRLRDLVIGHRLVELLARAGVAFAQLLVALSISGSGRPSPGPCELRLVARDDRLDFAVVESEQQIALLDELAILDVLLASPGSRARDFTTTVAGDSIMPMVRRRMAKSSTCAGAVVTGAAAPAPVAELRPGEVCAATGLAAP